MRAPSSWPYKVGEWCGMRSVEAALLRRILNSHLIPSAFVCGGYSYAMRFGDSDDSARTGSFAAALALSHGEAVLLLRLVLNEETKKFVSICADLRLHALCIRDSAQAHGETSLLCGGDSPVVHGRTSPLCGGGCPVPGRGPHTRWGS